MPDISWQNALEIQSIVHARDLLSKLPTNVYDIILRSPEQALATTGSRYWLALLISLQKEFPQRNIHLIVDAGDAAGRAQGAISDGHLYVRFTGDTAVKEKLSQIAQTSQCILI